MNSQGSPKNGWRIVEVLGKIITPLIVAALSAGLGYYFEEVSRWTNRKAEILQKTAPYLRSDDPEVRYVATIFLTGFENEKKMIELFFDYIETKENNSAKSTGNKNPGHLIEKQSDKVAEIMTDTEKPPDGRTCQQKVSTVSEPAGGGGGNAQAVPAMVEKFGWVFMGRYDTKVACWNTKQFNFLDHQSPKDLVDKTLQTVKDKTSVWDRPPSPFGVKGELLCILGDGSEFKVVDHKNWAGAGYIWAKVAYQVKADNPG